MKSILAGLALAVVTAVPSGATTADAAATGTGTFGTACLEVAGVSNHTAGRGRWVFLYFPEIDSPGAGVCPENQHHIEPAVTCASSEVVDGAHVLYLAAREGRTTHLVKIVDRGPSGDEAGYATTDAPAAERCGAASVQTHPLTAGQMSVLAYGSA